MIIYRHFALPNLYLTNGYSETHTEFGSGCVYEREDDLEHCVRRLLIRNPIPLRGWDLRFLRQGLELTQADFGQMVGRDAQTVARWEKSADVIPKFVDLIIRIRFACRFEQLLSIQDVLSISDGEARPLPQKVLLTLRESGWTFDLEPSFKLTKMVTQAATTAELPLSHRPTVTIYEGRRSTKQNLLPTEALDVYWGFTPDIAVHSNSPIGTMSFGKVGKNKILLKPLGTNDGYPFRYTQQ